MANSRDRLTNAFKHFPGIGRRQARRFVYFLLSRGQPFAEEMAEEMKGLHENTTRCEVTHQIFQQNNQETKSPIARDPNRDWSRILVVETDMDLEAIERTATYNGLYFVLGTNGSLADDNLADTLELDTFKNIIESFYDDRLEEIIIATSVTPEGEDLKTTVTRYLETNLEQNIAITTLGRGLSSGSELEYIDDNTLQHALDGRS